MRSLQTIALLGVLGTCTAHSSGQDKPGAPPPLPTSKVQAALDTSAKGDKFTFVVFAKGDSPAYQAMLQTVKEGVAARSKQATYIAADASAAAEQALVEKLGVGRAPMPLTVAIAPNGAVTGIFPKTVTDQQMTDSIVAPTMMRCMKSLQEQKLVFVCLTSDASAKAQVPSAVQTLQRDPHFKDRIELVSMKPNDPAETRLIEQMKLDFRVINGPYAVLIAPPGVLIGHFGGKATPEEIAAAIHKAGKCCDDPNCKHNQASPTVPNVPKTAIRRK